ncbi:MAG: DUF420 domain-containing protein [Armatimonadetes bacterium]|nr:DUF420 domain-containing protein [Armatimonadota bacterium]
MSVADFPAVNASLNGLSALLLVTGFVFIRQGKVSAHRACMVAALVSSMLFLGCYLYYHAHAGSKPFQGQGTLRLVYFTVLLTHTLLAVAVPVLAIVTLNRGLAGSYERHRAIARWTLPIWLYVSVTGVVIYWMLYRMPL